MRYGQCKCARTSLYPKHSSRVVCPSVLIAIVQRKDYLVSILWMRKLRPREVNRLGPEDTVSEREAWMSHIVERET